MSAVRCIHATSNLQDRAGKVRTACGAYLREATTNAVTTNAARVTCRRCIPLIPYSAARESYHAAAPAVRRPIDEAVAKQAGAELVDPPLPQNVETLLGGFPCSVLDGLTPDQREALRRVGNDVVVTRTIDSMANLKDSLARRVPRDAVTPAEPGPDVDMSWLPEYDAAADWCARRGIKGDVGDPLPDGLSAACLEAIQDDPDAFQERVRATAYAISMEGHPDES
jgi:hypothetical protein